VVGQAKKQLDYFQFELTSQGTDKELVTMQPVASGNVLLPTASLIVDPDYEEAKQSFVVKELVLEWNQKTVNVVAGAVILLFLLGILFVRLVRSR